VSSPSQPAWARDSAILRFGDLAETVDITPEWAFEGSTGAGVRVAIIDSGIDAAHPALEGCVDVEGSIDVSIGDDGTVVTRRGPHGDVFGHGTACAGIIHTLAPQATITSVRVLGPSLTGTAAAFHAGLAWAVEEGFDIINLSLGTSKKDWALAFHEVCDRAYFGGSFVVTAANNVARVSYPSLFASVASVACNTSGDALRFHANPQPPTEFLARGIDVEVPWLDGGSTVTTGNSFAAPHIAAFAALVKSKHPELRPFQIKATLWATAANVREASEVDVAGRRATIHVGGGRGTAMALVRRAEADRLTTPADASHSGDVADDGAPRRARRTMVAAPAAPVTVDGIVFGDVVARWRWGTVRDGRRTTDGRLLTIRDLGRTEAVGALRDLDRAIDGMAHPHLAAAEALIDEPPSLVTDRPATFEASDRPSAAAGCVAATAAIAAAHTAGLVHGDLGAGWLTQRPDGRLAVAGVGVPVALGTPPPDAATTLTPAVLQHLAPEQLGDHVPTTSTDVYALGLLWCRLLTGALPWPDVDHLGAFLRQRLATPARPVAELDPGLPEAFTTELDRALSLDPDDRHRDAAALGRAVAAALDGTDLLAGVRQADLLDTATYDGWFEAAHAPAPPPPHPHPPPPPGRRWRRRS